MVPFSQRSGVLEWCSGTVPIGEFLVDPNKGAHKRFRPRDWTNLACRRKMMVLLGHIQRCYGKRSHTQLLRDLSLINHSCLSLLIAGTVLNFSVLSVFVFNWLNCRRLRSWRLMRSSRPTARCARTSGRSSGISAWKDSWTPQCGWRNGWLTLAVWPPLL